VGNQSVTFTPFEKVLIVATGGALTYSKFARTIGKRIVNAGAIQTRTIFTNEVLSLRKAVKLNILNILGFTAGKIAADFFLGKERVERIKRAILSPYVTIHDIVQSVREVSAVTDINTGSLIADLKVDPTIRG
jgi:hypothetical protein